MSRLQSVTRGLLIAGCVLLLGGVIIDCDTAGGGLFGCEGMQELPAGAYPHTQRQTDVAQVRLTKTGLSNLTTVLLPVIKQMLGDSLTIPMQKGMAKGSERIGIITVNYEAPTSDIVVELDISSLALAPVPASTLRATINLISKDKTRLDFTIPAYIGALGINNCNLRVYTDAPWPVTIDLILVIESDKRLNLRIGTPSISTSTLKFSGCATDNILIGSFLSNMLREKLGEELNKQMGDIKAQMAAALYPMLCYTCGANGGQCPSGTACSADLCYAPGVADLCKAKPLGVETAVDAGALLGDSLPGAHSALLYLAAAVGGTLKNAAGATVNMVDTGLNLGLFGGARPAVDATDCVTPAPLPWDGHIAAAQMYVPRYAYGDTAVINGASRTYDAVVGLSEVFLDVVGGAAYNAGTLCLTLDSTNPAFGDYLSLDLFGMALGSLNVLARNRDVPLLLALQPTAPLDFTIGEGVIGVNPETGAPVLVKPHVTIDLPGLHINLFLEIDNRMVQVLTLAADVRIAVGLQLGGVDGATLEWVMGEQPLEINNMAVRYNVLEESDVAVLNLVTTLMGALLGQLDLASVLPSIDLGGVLALDLDGDGTPDIGLDVLQIKPDGAISGREGAYQMLSIYTAFGKSKSALAAEARVRTLAWRSDSRMPNRYELTNTALPASRRQPSVTLLLDGTVPEGYEGADLEYSYRIDDGLWTPFFASRRLIVRDPRLLAEGRRRIEVRARVVGEPATVDATPQVIAWTVDRTAPKLRLLSDRDGVTVAVSDNLSSASELLLAWRVDGGAWRPLEEPRLAWGALPARGTLEVSAVDESGNVAVATRTLDASGGVATSVPGGEAPSGGCDGGGAAPFGLALLVFAWLSRTLRRRRSGLVMTLALLLAVGVVAGCDTGTQVSTPYCITNDQCPDDQCCNQGKCGQCVQFDGDIEASEQEGAEVSGDGETSPDAEPADTKDIADSDPADQTEAQEDAPADAAEEDPETDVVEGGCLTHDDCRKDGEPDGKYYCSRRTGQCLENECYDQGTDATPDMMCHTVKNSACAVCDMTGPVHACIIPRCQNDNDCLCQTCAEEQNPVGVCDAASGACLCVHPCRGDCPGGTYCCQNRLDLGTFNQCVSCPTYEEYCPGIDCPAGYEPRPREELPEGWRPGQDTCELMDGDACGYREDAVLPSCSRDEYCRPLPPLEQGPIGRHIDFVIGPDGALHLAAYNEGVASLTGYGDLMYGFAPAGATFPFATDMADTPVTWQFVDGVPAVDPTGDPNGPRGGVSAAGDDVGYESSIALDALGLPSIAYYDASNGDLKFARRDADGLWQVHVVDREGDTGRFPSLRIAADGTPIIVYQQVSATGAPGGVSALKLAVASSPAPEAESDWTLVVVDAEALPQGPCFEACGKSEVCALHADGCVKDDGSCGDGCPSGMICRAKVCHEPSSSAACGGCGGGLSCLSGAYGCAMPDDPQKCNGACQSGQACVSGACVQTASPAILDPDAIPEGTGLWPHAVQFSDDAAAPHTKGKFVIFYYQRSGYDGAWRNVRHGNLKMATVNAQVGAGVVPAGADFSIITARGADGLDDVGQFLAVTTTSDGSYALSWKDADARALTALVYTFAPALDSYFTMEFTVDGPYGAVADSPVGSYVGADSALVLSDDLTTLHVVYQNQSTASLHMTSAVIGSSQREDAALLGGPRNGGVCAPQCVVCDLTGDACLGLYGFFSVLRKDADGHPVVGSFYYDLKREPDGWGVWFIKP